MLRNRSHWLAAAALLGLLGLLSWPFWSSRSSEGTNSAHEPAAKSGARRFGARPSSDDFDDEAKLSLSRATLNSRIEQLQQQLTIAAADDATHADTAIQLELVRALGPHASERTRNALIEALSAPATSPAVRGTADGGADSAVDSLGLAVALLQSGATSESLAPWQAASALEVRPTTDAAIAGQLELRSLLVREGARRTPDSVSELDAARARAQARLTLLLRNNAALSREQWALAGAVLRNASRAATPTTRDYLANLFAKLRALPPPDDVGLQAARLEALATGTIATSLRSAELRVHLSQMADVLSKTAAGVEVDASQLAWWSDTASSLRALRLARTVIFRPETPSPRTE